MSAISGSVSTAIPTSRLRYAATPTTHFTSPIRRYSDLTLHRLLKAILSDDEKKRAYLLRNIEPLTIKISELEREATRVEWDFMARKYARWADAHKETTLHAVVIEAAQIPAATTDRDILGMRIFCDKSDLLLFDRIEAKTNIVHLAQAKIFVIVENTRLTDKRCTNENSISCWHPEHCPSR